jgi:hypothetical protein
MVELILSRMEKSFLCLICRKLMVKVNSKCTQKFKTNTIFFNKIMASFLGNLDVESLELLKLTSLDYGKSTYLFIMN